MLSHLDVDFIQGSISQPRSLQVSSLHLLLQSLYMHNLSSILFGPLSNDSIHRSKSLWGPGFLESRPTCTCEPQCALKKKLNYHKIFGICFENSDWLTKLKLAIYDLVTGYFCDNVLSIDQYLHNKLFHHNLEIFSSYTSASVEHAAMRLIFIHNRPIPDLHVP